jgi:hypothetical protein
LRLDVHHRLGLPWYLEGTAQGRGAALVNLVFEACSDMGLQRPFILDEGWNNRVLRLDIASLAAECAWEVSCNTRKHFPRRTHGYPPEKKDPSQFPGLEGGRLTKWPFRAPLHLEGVVRKRQFSIRIFHINTLLGG